MIAPLPASADSVVLVPAPWGGGPLVLRLGQQVVAEVLQLDASLGRALLSIGGRRVEAQVPPGLERGTTVRLSVLDASPERLVLRLIPEATAGPSGQAAASPASGTSTAGASADASLGSSSQAPASGALAIDAALAELDLPPSPLLRAAAAALVEAGRPLAVQSLLAIRSAIAGRPGPVELNARTAAELLRLGLPLTARALDLARTALLQPAPIGDLLRELLEALDGLDRGGDDGMASAAPSEPGASAGPAGRSDSSSAVAAGASAPEGTGSVPAGPVGRVQPWLEPGMAPAGLSTEPPAEETASGPSPAESGQPLASPSMEIAGLRHALERLAITPGGGATTLRRVLAQVAGAPEALPGVAEAVPGAPEALPAETIAGPAPFLSESAPSAGPAAPAGEAPLARVLLAWLIEAMDGAIEPAAPRLAGQAIGTGEGAGTPPAALPEAGRPAELATLPVEAGQGPRPAMLPVEKGPGPRPVTVSVAMGSVESAEAGVSSPVSGLASEQPARPLPPRLETATAGGAPGGQPATGAPLAAPSAATQSLDVLRALAQRLYDRLELQQLANAAALVQHDLLSGAPGRGAMPTAGVVRPELGGSGELEGAPAAAPTAPAVPASAWPGSMPGPELSFSLPFVAGGRLATLELRVQREPAARRGAAAAPVPGVRARLAVQLDHLGEIGADLRLAPALAPEARPALRCRLAATTEMAHQALAAAAGELQARLSVAGFHVEAIDCVVQAPGTAAEAGTRSWPLRHVNVEA